MGSRGSRGPTKGAVHVDVISTRARTPVGVDGETVQRDGAFRFEDGDEA